MLQGVRRYRFAATLALLCAVAVAAPARADDNLYTKADLEKLQRTFAKLSRDVAPTVVAIETFRSIDNGRQGWVINSQGSGFVYSADGTIVTNHHVVGDADRIEVTVAGGKKYDGTLVQFDPRSDISVVRIDAKDLRVAPLGDLADLQQGQWVFTAGSPFGLATGDGSPSVSFGVIAAIGRDLTSQLRSEGDDRYYGNLIETDANINPGNSGGPLFDLNGRVVGISTAMMSKSGVAEGEGFAIPISSRTKRIMQTLASGEVVRYGYLGVRVVELNQSDARRSGLPSTRGAVVQGFADNVKNSPAELAGLRPNDVIVEFDGQPVTRTDDLIRIVGGTPVGAAVEVKYYRDRRQQTAKVTLVERPETVVARNRPAEAEEQIRHMEWRGLVLVEPTDALLSTHDLSRDDAGLFVFEVPRDSIFYRKGLRKNTMIMSVNGNRVRSLEELLQRERNSDKALRLDLANGQSITIPR